MSNPHGMNPCAQDAHSLPASDTRQSLLRRIVADAARSYDLAMEAAYRARHMMASAVELLAMSDPLDPAHGEPAESGGDAFAATGATDDNAIDGIAGLFARQNRMASREECDEKLFVELDRIDATRNPTLRAQRMVMAMQRYRACMERKRPILIVPEEPNFGTRPR